VTLFFALTAFSAEPLATLPFELIDNRIFVDISINDEPPLSFILDTGGSYCVDSMHMDTLGLTAGESLEVGGAGSGSVPGVYTRLSTVRLGPITQTDQPAISFSLEGIRKGIGFDRLDGVVGKELLASYIVDINYVDSQLTVWEPGTWTAPEDAVVIPFKMYRGKPMVDATVQGVAARLLVDTGDRSSLTLNAPFVKKHDLVKALGANTEAITGFGIGGPIPARLGAASLALGEASWTGVVARLPLTHGAFASADFDGSIGTGVLRTKRLVIDYPNDRLLLLPGTLKLPTASDGILLAKAD
jgi:hypothetical protein